MPIVLWSSCALLAFKFGAALVAAGGEAFDEVVGYESDRGAQRLELERIVEAAVRVQVDGALDRLHSERGVSRNLLCQGDGGVDQLFGRMNGLHQAEL